MANACTTIDIDRRMAGNISATTKYGKWQIGCAKLPNTLVANASIRQNDAIGTARAQQAFDGIKTGVAAIEGVQQQVESVSGTTGS